MRCVKQNPFSIRRLLDRLILRAGVAELADALDSKSSARKGVEVQVLSPVLFFSLGYLPPVFGASDGAFFLPDVNREPNPLFTEPASGGRKQWLKIAGY